MKLDEVLGTVGVEAVGEVIHRAVGQDADDPAAEVVGPPVVLPPVMIGITLPDGVGGHADDARALNRAPGSGVVGNGATGVTVTYRPDARSLTNRLPP